MRRYKILFIMLFIVASILSFVACSEEKKEKAIIEIPKEELVSETEPEVEEPQIEEPQIEEQQPEEPRPEESKVEDTKPRDEQKPTTNNSNNEQKPTTGNAQSSKYPYYIRVNRLANCVTVYKQDDTGEYTVPIKAMVCSVGNPIYKTPAGKFKISNKYTWRYLYGDQYGQYATRINGPILFHSVPYKAQKNDSLKTDYYNNLGVADSMGCIRLTCADAKWIYDNCPKGTTVEIYEASDPGPLGKPSTIKIDVNSPYAGWDPTDPNPNNPWRSQKPIISGVKDIETTCGTVADLISHISAKDWLGNMLTVIVSPNIDFNVSGEYQVVYSATDSVGNVTQIAAKVIVKELTEPSDEPEQTPDGNENDENQGDLSEEGNI